MHFTFCKSTTVSGIITIKACRIMKLVAVLLTVFCLHAGASGYSQGITLSFKNTKLEKVFAEIQRQSGYRFVYKWEILSDAKPVDVQVKNAGLKDVLELCFKDQPLFYTIIDDIIVVSKKEKKEEPTNAAVDGLLIDVHGKVVNEKGEAVTGATISVKGTDKLTTTNENGEFFLSGISENSELFISHVSFEPKQISLEGKKDVVIQLKLNINELNPVVVNTGYQLLKPNEVNSSTAVIDNKLLNAQTGSNILQRLDGVTSSLLFNVGKSYTPGQSKTGISIRGPSSIEAPLDPLIVLDNFPYEGDINNINPNDVESITVLKDAAATSIYGPRGGNGVIVITTKKGRFNQKLGVEFNANLIVTQKPDLYSLPEMSVSDYIYVEQFLFNKGYFDSRISDTRYPALTPAVEVFLKKRSGLISASDSASQIDALKATDSRDQYDKYFNQPAILRQFALSLRGGSGNIAWLGSASYDNSQSSAGARNNKINIRFINTYKPIANLKLDVGFYYTNNQTADHNQPTYNSVDVDGRSVPYLRFADENGNPLSVASVYREGYTDTAGMGKLLDWKYYPLDDYKHTLTSTEREEILGNVSLSYQVIRPLSVDIKYQYQRQATSTESLSDVGSFYTRDLINRFAQLNRATGIVTLYPVPVGDILNISGSDVTSQNLRGQLNFNKTIGVHNITSIAVAEIRDVISSGNSLRLYGYHGDPLFSAVVDFRNQYPTLPAGNYNSISGAPTPRNTTIFRTASFLANMAYSYKGKYSVYSSVRRDGSNIFGATTNNKWKPLWSVALGWDLSKEKWYKLATIPYLRLTASLGYSGNIDQRKSPLAVGAYGTAIITSLPFPRLGISTLNDPSLRWEKVQQLNLAADFSLENKILSGRIEFYQKKASDLYGPSPFDYTNGGTNVVTKNVANMEGRGVDVSLQSNNINKAIRWTTGFLLSYHNDKLTNYFGDSYHRVSSLLGDGNTIAHVVGKPFYAIAAYKWGGLNSSGDPQGYLNGHLSTDYEAIVKEGSTLGVDGNIKYVGSTSPLVFGSLINRLTWRQFSCSFNLVYKLGYYFRKPSLSYSALYSQGAGHKDFEKRWQKPGDEMVTTVPAMVYTDYQIGGKMVFDRRESFYYNAEINVLRADHIRFQWVNVDYTFPFKNKKIPFESIQLYANIANLGIVWRANKEKLDPDYPYGFPLSKQFTLGLRTGL